MAGREKSVDWLSLRHSSFLLPGCSSELMYNAHLDAILRLVEFSNESYVLSSEDDSTYHSDSVVSYIESSSVADIKTLGPTVSQVDSEMLENLLSQLLKHDSCNSLDADGGERSQIDSIETITICQLLEKFRSQLRVLEHVIGLSQGEAGERHETLVQMYQHQESFCHTVQDRPANTSLVDKARDELVLVLQVFQTLNRELKKSNTFTSLQEAVDKRRLQRQEFATLKTSANERQVRIEFLTKQVNNMERELVREEEANQAELYRLNEILQDITAKTAMEVRVVEETGKARLESVMRQCAYKLNKRNELISERMSDGKREIRRNAENEKRLKIDIDCLKVRIEERMKKFEDDVDTLDEKLSSLRAVKLDNEQYLIEARNSYNECFQAIADDMEEERQSRMKVFLEVKRDRAATLIQHWWRKLLTKNNFYKKKVSKKSKKKKPAKKTKGVKKKQR